MAAITQTTTAVLPSQIIMLPSPGMGHLIPLLEFAKRLVLHHDLSVFITIPTDSSSPSKAQTSVLDYLPNSITYTFLPPVNFDDLPTDAAIETRITLTVSRSLPSLHELVREQAETHRVVALVADLFGTDAFDVATELNIPRYMFFPSTAMLLSFFFYLPKLDEMYTCEYRDVPESIRIPGAIPIHGKDLLDPVQDRKNDAYKWVLHHAKRSSLAQGIFVNTFIDLEPGPIKALKEKEPGKPAVYPVGPLIQSGTRTGPVNDVSGSLKWLDDQPDGSVLFVSFGSGGTLSSEQLTELAFGLEMSEQRFLWVVRSPTQSASNANYFSAQTTNDPFDFLPTGFLDRTKGRGLLLPSWAPQIQVLSHGSTGGFLTHCGWNSTLESVVHGVPLIAWPLYAEQKMNATMLEEDLRIALRPKANEDGIIGRGEIARVVKGLMEGEEGKTIRSRMRELKSAAATVLSEDGSSSKALAEVANMWKKNSLE